MAGFFADVMSLFKRHTAAAEIGKLFIAFVGGVVATVPTVHLFLKDSVEKAVSKQMAPYEAMYAAQSALSAEDYEIAADMLRLIMNQKESSLSDLPKNIETNFYQIFLVAAANVEKPEDYSPQVDLVIQRLGPVDPDNAWEKNQIGWYLLRMGKASQAGDYFEQATNDWNAVNNKKATTDSVRGLLVAELAQGHVGRAFEQAHTLGKIDPGAFGDPDRLIRDMQGWKNDRDYARFTGKYPDHYAVSLDGLISALQEELKRSNQSPP